MFTIAEMRKAIVGDEGTLEFLSSTPLEHDHEYLVLTQEVGTFSTSDDFIRCRIRVGTHARRIAQVISSKDAVWVLAAGTGILPKVIVSQHDSGRVAWADARDRINTILKTPDSCTLGPDTVYCFGNDCVDTDSTTCLPDSECFDATGRHVPCVDVLGPSSKRLPPNKALQLTSNSAFQLGFGSLLASTSVPSSTSEALLAAAERQIR